jgi:outer membrane protein assembly factor BamB
MPRRMTVLSVFVCACLALALVGRTSAENWPRFRGPNGAGIAADKDIPVQWSEQSGILWKVPLPGQGNSSPIVWGERLFVQTSSAAGRQRSLLCLSVKDGKVLWSRSMPAMKQHIHPKNSLASATPATDGERVYAAFWDGRDILLAAYDFDGKQLWNRDLGSFTSQHGAGASPVVYAGKVFLANDQDGNSKLIALNAADGSIAWEATRPAFRACYSAPFIRQQKGARPELVVVSTLEISGYDPETGTKDWGWAWKFTAKMPLRTTASPVYDHDTIFACSGDGNGDRHMVAVHLDGQGKDTQPRLLWQNKKDFPYVPTLLSRGDHVYFVNDRGVAGCYDARTGKRMWQERLQGASMTASPVLIDGKIYAASEEGDVFVLAAEPVFRLLARNALGEGVRATPAVADGRLFVRGQDHLFCIGKRSGR